MNINKYLTKVQIVKNRHEAGDALRTLRQKAGISQRELGLALSISRSRISKIELGTTSIEADVFIDIAEYLKACIV